MKTPFREARTFKLGQSGERLTADWLMRQGCYVIPSYDYAGEDGDKAPKLSGLWDGYPVPNLDVCKNGHRFWVEVRTKAKISYYRKDGQWQHGIDYRLVEHYRTVQLISGCPCWLFIFESWNRSRWLICQRLDTLGEPRIGVDRGNRMGYWNRELFRQLEQIPAGD